jgi:2,4-dienoyl-CoA reductase-like NADH-dependent reductase (Old Yellow Enzyme family)
MLFTPVKIGNMEVPNRFVVPPEGTNLANADGFSHFRDSIS